MALPQSLGRPLRQVLVLARLLGRALARPLALAALSASVVHAFREYSLKSSMCLTC